MRVLIGLSIIAGVTLFPWMCWSLLRRAWLLRRERRVLLAKYGDLDMFSQRLREWNIVDEPFGKKR